MLRDRALNSIDLEALKYRLATCLNKVDSTSLLSLLINRYNDLQAFTLRNTSIIKFNVDINLERTGRVRFCCLPASYVKIQDGHVILSPLKRRNSEVVTIDFFPECPDLTTIIERWKNTPTEVNFNITEAPKLLINANKTVLQHNIPYLIDRERD